MPVRFDTSLRRYRRNRELHQEDLARWTGIERSMLSRMENGYVLPTPDELQRLCRVLGVSPHHLYLQDVLTIIGRYGGDSE